MDIIIDFWGSKLQKVPLHDSIKDRLSPETVALLEEIGLPSDDALKIRCILGVRFFTDSFPIIRVSNNEASEFLLIGKHGCFEYDLGIEIPTGKVYSLYTPIGSDSERIKNQGPIINSSLALFLQAIILCLHTLKELEKVGIELDSSRTSPHRCEELQHLKSKESLAFYQKMLELDENLLTEHKENDENILWASIAWEFKYL